MLEDRALPTDSKPRLPVLNLAGVLRSLRAPILGLALILAFAFVIYTPVLDDWFQTDDFLYLRAAQVNSPLEYVGEAFDIRDTSEPVGVLTGHYRPLYAITILAEADLFGLNAWPHHLLAVLNHLANAGLVWLIGMRLTRRPFIALFAALIFALHPTYVPAVSWISEQTVRLATLGTLLAFWFFMKSLGDSSRWRLWYAASLLSFVGAMFYHPKSAPLAIVLVAYYFLVKCDTPGRMFSPRSWLTVAPFVGLTLVEVVAGLWLRQDYPELGELVHFGPHIADNLHNYLRMAVIPHPLLNVFLDSHRAIIILVWIGIVAWLMRNAEGRRLHVILLLWFAVAIVPALSVDLGAHGRELYIAGPALALILSSCVAGFLDALPRRNALPQTLLGIVILAAVLSLASWRTVLNQRDFSQSAVQSHRFIEELTDTYPNLPENTNLYVVGAPFALRLFGDIYLVDAIRVHYGDIGVYGISEERAKVIEQEPEPRDRIFRFDPG